MSGMAPKELAPRSLSQTEGDIRPPIQQPVENDEDKAQPTEQGEFEVEAEWLLSNYMEVVQVRCKLCQMSCPTQNQLLDHIRTTHFRPILVPPTRNASVEIVEEDLTSTGFICGKCSLVFASLDLCKDHMLQVHTQPLETSPMSDLKESETIAIPSEYPSGKQPCPYPGCLYQFGGQDMVHHQSCHHGESFKCSQCQKMFETWRRCALHLWQNHELNVDLLSCPICANFKTAFPIKLKNHMWSSHSQGAEPNSKSMPVVGSKKRQCDICSKFFSDSKSLKKHVQAVHGKLRPYICQICNHQSARRTMLEMHMRQHTGEKPFSCDICQYRTGDHNSLRRHKMRHTGHRPYKCPFCPYSCIQSSPFKYHLEKKHPNEENEVIFTCETCGFKSINRQSYIDHVSIRHEIDNKASDPKDCETPIKPQQTPAGSKPSQLKARTKLKKRLISMNRANRTKEEISHQGVTTIGSGNRTPNVKAKDSIGSVKIIVKTEKCAKKALPEDEDSLTCIMAHDLGGTTIPA
ncbi:transcriptional repressor CTCF-like [Tigriopus californicus]|uniref:transcriptional repressor CTCF-like n=1 Tax=Tigriopus californicus TaxID=6832 RepID=UPI0027DA1B48|nr:transcriptional repressor CTCF-like [Tigriopus californicus]